ncbi:MAG: hypothetical protein IPK20_20085 [Betaproteobacteria bacterium]|nr:hypothetical protein [Betaproteobacteria bacterium]
MADATFIADVKTQTNSVDDALRAGTLAASPSTNKCGACDYRGMSTAGRSASKC